MAAAPGSVVLVYRAALLRACETRERVTDRSQHTRHRWQRRCAGRKGSGKGGEGEQYLFGAGGEDGNKNATFKGATADEFREECKILDSKNRKTISRISEGG